MLPSSTNPTRPYTVNTVDEHLDMLMVCHHLDPSIAEDVAFAESRIRRETIAAEDILHDLGAFSMISSDSQAMGRVGEVITRTWQTAHKMKVQRGALAEDTARATTTSASSATSRSTRSIRRITHGIAHEVGSIEVGKLADLVLWQAGVLRRQAVADHQGRHDRRGADGRPERVDPDAAARPLPADVRRARPRASSARRVTFVSAAALDGERRRGASGSRSRSSPSATRAACARPTWATTSYTPTIEVDPETYEVRADGELLTCEPASVLPLAQRYFLF